MQHETEMVSPCDQGGFSEAIISMHDKSGLMIARMSQDQPWDHCSPPRAARTAVKGISTVFTWKGIIKRPRFAVTRVHNSALTPVTR